MPPKPKAPAANASKAEHKKHARQILDDPEYKVKPQGYQDKTDTPKEGS